MATFSISTPGIYVFYDDHIVWVEEDVSIEEEGTVLDLREGPNATLLIDGTILSSGAGLDPAILVDNLSNGTDVVISDSGSIVSTQHGVEFEQNGGTLVNQGTIQAQSTAIITSGTDPTIQNFGTIVGESGISAATLYLNNHGDLTAQFTAVQASAGGGIQNTGRITSTNGNAFFLLNTNVTVQNLAGGVISASLVGLAFADVPVAELSNEGSISSGGTTIGVIDSDLFMVNTGSLVSTGFNVIEVDGSGMVEMNNSGTLSAAMGEAVDGRDATEVSIVNTGEIVGDVTLGAGDDMVLTFGAGVIAGEVDGGSGADVIVGGAAVDVISGGADSDYIDGGAGDDDISTSEGADIVLGGAGNDVITVDRGGAKFLLGEDGSDTFVFTDTAASPAGGEITTILDLLGLLDRQKDRVKTYSGGMKRRIMSL